MQEVCTGNNGRVKDVMTVMNHKKTSEDEKIKQAMLEMLFERAKNHFSKKVMEFGMRPGRYGTISRPDGHARVSSDCGDTIEMFLRLKGGRIDEARFTSEGCLTTVAAAEAAAELATGKTVRECLRINQSAIITYLDGLPEGSSHCAYLAALSLHRALRDYAVHRQGLWRNVTMRQDKEGV